MRQVYYVSAFYANNMLVDIFGGKTMENKVIVLCGAPGSGKTTVRMSIFLAVWHSNIEY